MSSMFERYGGFAVVSRIVSAFYDKILDSPVTAPYFEETDMKTQIDHQTKFISSLMGGPASYTNDMLERVHRPLQVTQEAFDEVAFLLKETFEDFDVEESDIKAIMNEIHNRARFVISA